ncbi:MAG TPA: hypothetical protein DEQ73_05965 [Phycisphaerales bacterium]|jgi:hypothetical protein|nr:hypothetical protein [Phycisphaerales bacterium]
MNRKGQFFMTTCLFGTLAACDRDGMGLNETSQEIQTIDGVPTVASDDPMYLACIEEAKNDAQRSLDGARARWMAGDQEAQRRFVVLYAPSESRATVWLQPRHWGPFRLECVPLETDLAEEGDIVVLTPDQILDWAEFGAEGAVPIKGGFTDRCGRMLEKARQPS